MPCRVVVVVVVVVVAGPSAVEMADMLRDRYTSSSTIEAKPSPLFFWDTPLLVRSSELFAWLPPCAEPTLWNVEEVCKEVPEVPEEAEFEFVRCAGTIKSSSSSYRSSHKPYSRFQRNISLESSLAK